MHILLAKCSQITAILLLCAVDTNAQNYPNKPIRFVISGIAGTSNFVARIIAQSLSASLGQQVVVDGREGGVIAAELVAKAAPDGYTLHLNGSALWLLPFMRSHVPYDPVRDFAPISVTVSTPNILVVHPSVPATSVKQLITLATSKPGELNCATGNAGTSNHLAAELFKSMAHVNITRIPYKGAAPAINDLISGQVQLMFASASAIAPHVHSGRLRALAVTSAQSSLLAPGLPTVAAAGVPGYSLVAAFGVFVPARTPTTIINRLHEHILRALREPAVKERLLKSGVEAVGSSPEELAALIKAEMTGLGKLITDAGIRDQ